MNSMQGILHGKIFSVSLERKFLRVVLHEKLVGHAAYLLLQKLDQ
jgi:hypothetical protein